MNYSRRSSHAQMSQINVVPYIDVMLVLLVIFMITAPLMNPGQIDLPSVSQSNAPPSAADAPLEVMIKKDTTLVLRDHTKGGVEFPVSREELKNRLQTILKKNPNQSVVISADKSVRYEEVVHIMDDLKQQHVKKIGLLAKIQ